MGKSSLSIQFAVNAAKAGAGVAFFSLEMPEEQLAMRMLCAQAGIDSDKYRSGFLTEQEWGLLGDAHEILSPLPLYVDDTPSISIPQLKAKAMRFQAEHKKLDMIVVDYLQRMADPGKGMYEQATNISKGLKSVARELNVPLVADCQLNRNPENRTDHRPNMGDLRDSGWIEQEADVVAFIYRGDQYRAKNDPKDHMAEFIVGKHRNGRCDTVYLRFEDSCARFESPAHYY
jgi:replicative DNA helicase